MDRLTVYKTAATQLDTSGSGGPCVATPGVYNGYACTSVPLNVAVHLGPCLLGRSEYPTAERQSRIEAELALPLSRCPT